EKKFKEINEAYQVLSNKEKRAQYDQFGTTFEAPGAGPWYGQSSPFGGFDFSEFFRSGSPFGGRGRESETDFDLSDLFEGFFGGARTRAERRRKGADISVDLEISLEEAFSGLTRTLEIKRVVRCGRCGGSGAEPGSQMKKCRECQGAGEVKKIRRTFWGSISEIVICPACQGNGVLPDKTCRECRGEGRVTGIKATNVEIPAGIQNGQTIKIAGEGEISQKGGLAGDLYVRIHIKPHRLFQREGDNLFYELPLAFSQAVLGAQIEILTIDGAVDLKIPAGAESGKILLIKGKGMKRIDSVGRGDLYVKIQVKTPKSLTREQKELLEKLKKEGL
ncbi:MAG: DnaJ C-terminal domain-containing protein, partial [bacterium]|nr:DnaJ C-terminal domain-containing protein [bacterium]